MTVALLVGVYPCCGWPAQRGTSQRPLPQSGCATQPHTPLTPPEASTYHLNPDSALSGTRQAASEAADSAAGRPGLVQLLLKHQDLIARPSGEVRQEEDDAAWVQEAEEEVSSEQQVTCQSFFVMFCFDVTTQCWS